LNHPKVKRPQILQGLDMYFKHPFKGTSSTQPEDKKMTNSKNPSGRHTSQDPEEKTGSGRRKKPSSKIIRPSGRNKKQDLEERTGSGRQKKPYNPSVRPTKKDTNHSSNYESTHSRQHEETHDLETATTRRVRRKDIETGDFETPTTRQIRRKKGSSGRNRVLNPNQTRKFLKQGKIEIPEYFPNDIAKRVYERGKLLGIGTQGIVYEAVVKGSYEFKDFDHPLKKVVIKFGKPFDGTDDEHPLTREINMGKHAQRGLVKLLDSGKIEATFPGHRKGMYPYAVYEKLSPFDRVPGLLNFVTATDIIINLIFNLTYVHKKMMLLDVKPENVMLRMPPKKRDASEEAYIRKVATGQYEPVFVDLGSSITRSEVNSNGGCIDRLFTSPIYLAPETATPKDEKWQVGTPNDIYSLMLTWYELLTQQKPYDHRNVEDREQLLSFVRDPKVSPISYDLLEKAVLEAPLQREGVRDQLVNGVMNIFKQSLTRAPEERPNAKQLFEIFRKVFNVKNRLPNLDRTNYAYDSGKGMAWYQDVVFVEDPSMLLEQSGEGTVQDFYIGNIE